MQPEPFILAAQIHYYQAKGIISVQYKRSSMDRIWGIMLISIENNLNDPLSKKKKKQKSWLE